MRSTVKTIWKYGIIFADSQYELNQYEHECNNVIYSGPFSKLKDDVAQQIVEIHPNFEKYYGFAGMPLYKTYGGLYGKKGTESPKISLKSLKTKKEHSIGMPYILIWQIMKMEPCISQKS